MTDDWTELSPKVMWDSLRHHGLQHARLSWPLPSPRSCSDSCPLSQWCHPTISSSAASFSFCLQTFPVSRSFPMSQLFTSGGQSIGASASVFPMNSQGWFLLGLTSLISLLPKGLSSLLQRHNLKASILHHSAFFMTQLSLSYMNTGKTWFIDGCGGRVKGALWGLF